MAFNISEAKRIECAKRVKDRQAIRKIEVRKQMQERVEYYLSIGDTDKADFWQDYLLDRK